MGIIKKSVPAFALSNSAMIAGNELEEEATKVIDRGIVKQWVGIGWVNERVATDEDYKELPEVTRDE